MKRTLFVLSLLTTPLSAQSLMSRSPNLSGTWVPDPAVIQFNFLHRFYVANSAGFNTVTNFPTFTLALGLPANLGVGMQYATKSDVPAKVSNEVQLFARWRHPLGTSGLTLAVTPAYNAAAKSLDGEVGVDWSGGPLTLLGAVRGMSKPFGIDTARVALAAGAVLHLNSYVGLSGDVAFLLSHRAGESAAWSAGLVFVIPGSPHTFSLQVSNVDVNNIEGSSRKRPYVAKKPLYGFEFTIPLHLARFRPWFHHDEFTRPATLRMIPSAEGPAAAEVKMNGIHYRSDTVTVNAGESVRWTNSDPLLHTVTFDDGSGTSADIPQNGSFQFRFDRPGTYPYHCTQHPFMKGVVIVK